jgi:DnaA family protein
MKQLALDFAIAARPTLDNFVVGRNGELAAQLRRIAAGPGEERFVYLWGAAGCGRTHLLKAAVAAMERAGASAAYVACGADAQWPEGLERMDCVALDDVDRAGADAQAAAFHLYNVLREHNRALVVAGAAPPMQLNLREDLKTRLSWGLVYQVHALTDDEKTRALGDYAAMRGFRLPLEVCEFLLTRVRRDMPSLLGMLDALDRYSLETRRPVTVPLARDLLAQRQDAGSGIQDSAARVQGSGSRAGD